MAWMAEDGNLVQEIMNCLSGNYDGPIGALVREADRLSVAQNLQNGPRTRFRAARVVPVIERLMQALRRMLQEGGLLPLNRSGGAGWVYEGDLWFVSKRLADEVRDYLRRNESGEGIPGDDKNDRLFDIWQEYGALIPNPATGGAIWRVRVEGEGYRHDFTMLRFPLSVLFARPQEYPAPMAGRITPLASVAGTVEANGTDDPPSSALTEDPAAAGARKSTLPVAPQSEPARARMNLTPSDGVAPQGAVQTDRPKPNVSASARKDVLPETDYLDDEETAQTADVPASPPPPEPIRGAVAPMSPRPPSQAERQTPEAAKRFIAWVQRGLADGSMAYNETGAMVHFVDAGMLLVSPRIFKEFAALFGEAGDGIPSDRSADKLGFGIQREVIRAGWHHYGPKKSNVLKYHVKRRNGTAGIVLSGMVIRSPERFVNPVPVTNVMLIPVVEERLPQQTDTA
jgi:hypothetical protein